MLFVATVTIVVYQKVHLLLEDISVVATEDTERCLGDPWMHRTLSHVQNYTTVISSTEIQANNSSPQKLNHEKTDAGGGPETKD